MRALVLSSCISILLAAGTGRAQNLWINEFHYDDTGTDDGEFVEVMAPASLQDLASVRLTLYNGGDGSPYGASHLLSTFTPGQTVSGFTLYSKGIVGLQNGAPDGLALDVGGTLVHFVSYEGGFTASAGPASGFTSFPIDVGESDASAAGSSLGLTGMGTELAAFTWTAFGVATPGLMNFNQAAVPEPHECALIAGVGLGVFAAWRRGRRSGALSTPGTPTQSQSTPSAEDS